MELKDEVSPVAHRLSAAASLVDQQSPWLGSEGQSKSSWAVMLTLRELDSEEQLQSSPNSS